MFTMNAPTPIVMSPPEVPPAIDCHRMRSEFILDPIFLAVKQQLVVEIEETMSLVSMTRNTLAKKLNIQPSAVTQSLSPTKGLQLSTLVRMADAMGCDVEINLIKRHPLRAAIAEELTDL